MTRLLLLLTFCLLFFRTGLLAQINDCADALVVCSDAQLAFNPIGPGIDDYADPDNQEGCIVALEQNSAWYYFEINPAAPPNLELGFTIHPLGGFGEDYDWALYGPDVNCGELGFPIRCSSSDANCAFCPDTGMGMGTTDVTEGPGTGDGFVSTLIVQPGQGFYLMIDNWLGTDNGFTLDWTGSAAEWLNCNTEPPCFVNASAGGDQVVCEGETIILDGGNNAQSYSWTGTNGGTGYLNDTEIEDPTVTLPPGFSGEILYTVSVTEDTCTDEAQMLLVIVPAPIVVINPVGPFCPTDDPIFLTATPAGGDWGGAVTSSTFDPEVLGPGIHTVTYTYDNPVCTVVQTYDIEVWESPEVVIDPSPAEFCDSEGSIVLTATGSEGAGSYSYHWTTPNEMADGATFDASYSGPHTVVVTDANGCTNSATTTVTNHENPDIQIIDPGSICNSVPIFTVQAIPPGGEFDGAIIDPSGEIYPNMHPPGTYSISYTYVDNHNCESTEMINISIITSPASIATNNGPVCSGSPIQLFGETDATGAGITWQWTGPNGYTSTEQNPTNATETGMYILQVFVGACPSGFDTTIVTITTAPDATATNGGPYCGGNPVQLFGNTSATGNITFNWSGPNGYTSNVQHPTDATLAGTYTLVVSNGSCASPVSSTDVIVGLTPDVSATNTGPYCAGEAIQLNGNTTASGAVTSYSWTGPNGYVSAMQNPTDATLAGNYQLVITVDGCPSAAAPTEVIINPVPMPVIVGQDTFCTGFSSILDVGGGFAQYAWSDASGGPTIEVTTAGTYSVTVTDANGCKGADTVDVVVEAELMPVISGSLGFCEGSNTLLDAGSGYTNYQWSTGGNTQFISVNTESNIGVTVTDADGCTGSTAVNTVINPNPVVTIGGSTTYCIGSFSVLDAGTGYAFYDWSTGSNNQVITVNMPGTYSVNVIDMNGCTGSGSVDVTESTSLSPVITGLPAFCEDGSTTLNAGSFATYVWSDGSMNQTLDVSTAATYSVTVSDGMGCSGSSAVAVMEVAPPTAQVLPDVTICNTVAGGAVLNLYNQITGGDMNGSWVDLDGSGASGLFDNLNFTGIAAGNYRFAYTTNSATAPCPESTYSTIVTVIDCVCPDVALSNAGELCNDNDVIDLSTLEQTTEAGTWSILSTPAGTDPATLNGSSFNAADGDPGVYTLQFSLSNAQPPGCPSTFETDVLVSQQVYSGSPSAPLSLCEKTPSVVILADLITGEDMTGVWQENGGSNSQGNAFNATAGTFTTDVQLAGTYSFSYSVNSNSICPDQATAVIVIVEPLPNVQIADIGVLDCNNAVTALNAVGSSSGPEYSITWSGPGIVIDGNESTLQPNVDEAGTYTLSITNNITGCTDEETVTVMANTDPPTGALVNALDPSCHGLTDGIITADEVAGGTAPYQFSLNDGPFGASPNFSQLPAGTYDLQIEDINGCRWDTSIVLVEPAPITLDLGPDLELGLGEMATIQAISNLSAAQIDTLIWSPADGITCIDVTCLEVNLHPSNTFNLQATLVDIFGCEVTDVVFVKLDKNRKVYIPTAFSPNGDGINDIFTVFADQDQVEQVKSFAVYSRWGEVIHDLSNFQPNDPTYGWDGSFGGETVNPGVFVYRVEVEFIDDVTEIYTGTVTILK